MRKLRSFFSAVIPDTIFSTSHLLSLGLGATTVLITAATGSQAAILNFDPAVTPVSSRVSSGYTIGTKFKTGSSPILINALGFQFINGTSFNVGLWNSSGLALATATVDTSGPVQNTFTYKKVSLITLSSNTEYYLGAYIPAGSNFRDGYNTTTTGFALPFSANSAHIIFDAYTTGASIAVPSSDGSSPSPHGRWGPANATFNPEQVPGPLPVLGVFTSFRVSRKLRKRLRTKACGADPVP
jgi:hypothetical protein